ncbi:MAG TPA: pyridoxal phosphate-dependent aminotransferase [Acidobacteriota bacterium]|nr:pyridoxal phosphate-dependent aminotransferase [Acidobacteriota bacterium]
MPHPFSARSRFPLRKNRLAGLLEKKRRQRAPLIDLTVSNPVMAGFRHTPETMASALSSPANCEYQPDPRGSIEARIAVAQYYGVRGSPVDPENLILTCSTSEAYAFLLQLLADPGDAILVPRPGYPLLEHLSQLASVRIRPYSLRFDHRWSIDLPLLAKRLQRGARAVLLVNPNNPTGGYVSENEWNEIQEACAEANAAVVCDEVFFDYALGVSEPFQAIPQCSALTFFLNGLSKPAALPQMKLGWILAAGPPGLRKKALHRLEVISDAHLSVSVPTQTATPSLLQASGTIRQRILQRLRRNLTFLEKTLADHPARALPVEGGWQGVVQLPRVQTDEQWALELLRHADILLHPGYLYDMETEAMLVVSLLPPCDDFSEGVRRLSGYVRDRVDC